MNDRTTKTYWKLEAYTNGHEIICLGQPPEMDESSPPYHNCDEMGCGSLNHVIARIPILQPTPELLWNNGYSPITPTKEQTQAQTHEN